MRHKYGKFYADWRDEHGRRHMKAFDTKKAALTYQEKQRRAVHRKKARASETLRRSARRGRKAAHRAATKRTSRTTSAAPQAVSAPTS